VAGVIVAFAPRLARWLFPGPGAPKPAVFRDEQTRHVVDETMDRRFRGAFDLASEQLPFLRGQGSFDLGPPPPPATLEADYGVHQETIDPPAAPPSDADR